MVVSRREGEWEGGLSGADSVSPFPSGVGCPPFLTPLPISPPGHRSRSPSVYTPDVYVYLREVIKQQSCTSDLHDVSTQITVHSRKSDCLGCAVLLCLVCLFDLACFFLPSFSSLI